MAYTLFSPSFAWYKLLKALDNYQISDGYIHVVYKCLNIYFKNKDISLPKSLFPFLPNLQILNKITKSVKSINLKTN